MCGIAGIVDERGGGGESLAMPLRRMVETIRHRGPDADGVRVEGRCGFGHTRLAIVDLSPSGAQPMILDDGALAITFNGEIFNHVELRRELEAAGRRFRSTCDTEVILHAFAVWGDACVERFNGDFAFALWESARQRLFCARDRAGVRPFFWARAEGRFLFASEVKALFAAGVPAAFDVLGLNELLTFWSTRAPRTVWNAVHELPAAHTLVLDAQGVSVRRYWEVDYTVDDTPRPDGALADELLTLLDDASAIRLRADVPVGAYLSGGLDSSVTTALAARHTRRLSTFSVTFEERDYDESGYQQTVASMLGTEHRSVRVSNAEIGALFPDVVFHAETPMLRTAPAPLMALAGLARRADFKVVLTGEGADEVLGGYDLFKEAKIRRFWARQPSSTLRPLLLRRLYPWMRAMRGQPDAYLRASFPTGAPGDSESDLLFSHVPRFKLADGMRLLLSAETAEAVRTHRPIEELRAALPAAMSHWDPFARAQYLESTLLLPGYLLAAQGDRMSMAHAVEGRYPFLDPRVIALGAHMPAQQKMRVLNEKAILKRAARGLVPDAVLARRKQPYRAPEAQAFYAPGAERARHGVIEEVLAPSSIRAAGILDAGAVGKLVEKVRRTGAASPREGMALVFAISTQLCWKSFIAPRNSL